MTLRHLGIFAQVCRAGSITGAAQTLNIAQPAVSLAIKELEAFYGAKLFERMNRRIYITDQGRRLRVYADTILSQFDESVRSLRGTDGGRVIRLGMNITVAEKRFYDFYAGYMRQNTDVRIEIRVDNSTQIEEGILGNELDVAVVDKIVPGGGITAAVLGKERMSVVCSPGYTDCTVTMSIERLAAERLLLRERGSGSRATVDMVFSESGLTPTIVMESVSTSALANAATAGMGIAVLPKASVTAQLSEGTLVELDTPGFGFRRGYYLIHHRQKLLPEHILRFCEALSAGVISASGEA